MNALPTALSRALLFFISLLLTAWARSADSIYPSVVLGRSIEFPRDHGAHPEFRTEWWYVTGWLEDETKTQRGFQITFFRSRPGIDEANPSQFAAKQLLFAHAALSDPSAGRLLRGEKSARAGFGLAQAKEGDLNVWIDDWKLQRLPDEHTLHANVSLNEFALQLDLRATQAPLLEGEQGFSQKGPDAKFASYYYSLPQLAVSGELALRKGKHRVRGVAWLDHEWSSEVLDGNASGWDWVGLNFDDGSALMAFRMRDHEGRQYWTSGTLRTTQGETHRYDRDDMHWMELRRWRSPHTQIEYPIEWRIDVGGRVLTLKPLMDDQENDARGSTGTLYWEGAVRVFEQDKQIGRGYLELTGYGGRILF